MADVVDPRIPTADIAILATDELAYTLDRNLLAGHGPLFTVFFTQKSTKVKTTQIFLPEASPHISDANEAVRDYVDYIKNGGSFLPALAEGEDKHAPYEEQIDHLIDLYLYASQIEDAKAQDDTMDCLLATYKDGGTGGLPWMPDADTIARIYDAGPLVPTLRKFLIDVHLWAGAVGIKEDRTHEGFLRELKARIFEEVMGPGTGGDLYSSTVQIMQVLVEKDGESRNKKKEAIPAGTKCCDYHKHGPGGECVNKKRKRPVEVLDSSDEEVQTMRPPTKKITHPTRSGK
ncbi:hypothetical protein AC578_1867 [Pseudocercospora eumusae]|uniref:BTB domain-containing protein n=1 Tax=Pseudocercospora eumusae TaxID=321146 RepID=A0A139GYG3_9PEZI|nr:hypothetical protein AC578_1867 [Pseudocercospora eumusae]